jgi:antitoxin component YwqK of YwqJK toxin-antitoxin module
MKIIIYVLLLFIGNHSLAEKIEIFYSSGKLKIENNLINGIPDGETKGYLQNGDLEYIRIYKNGILQSNTNFKKTNLKSDTNIKQQCSYENEKNKMLKLFQSEKEPIAKDAIWTHSLGDIFKVGVYDNGTSRNGYAQYVCSTLHADSCGFDEKNILIQIIDYSKLIKNNEWIKLGEYRCK